MGGGGFAGDVRGDAVGRVRGRGEAAGDFGDVRAEQRVPRCVLQAGATGEDADPAGFRRGVRQVRRAGGAGDADGGVQDRREERGSGADVSGGHFHGERESGRDLRVERAMRVHGGGVAGGVAFHRAGVGGGGDPADGGGVRGGDGVGGEEAGDLAHAEARRRGGNIYLSHRGTERRRHRGVWHKRGKRGVKIERETPDHQTTKLPNHQTKKSHAEARRRGGILATKGTKGDKGG